jgi:hypothetical protein
VAQDEEDELTLLMAHAIVSVAVNPSPRSNNAVSPSPSRSTPYMWFVAPETRTHHSLLTKISKPLMLCSLKGQSPSCPHHVVMSSPSSR